jgi:hypothetical protein
VSFVDFQSTNSTGPCLISFHVWLLRILTTSVKVGPKVESYQERHPGFLVRLSLYALFGPSVPPPRYSIDNDMGMLSAYVCVLGLEVGQRHHKLASELHRAAQSCTELSQICKNERKR